MENKIKEQENYIEKYNKAIERGEMLLAGLETYEKNIINKTFFEKFFMSRYTKQDIINLDNSEHKEGDIIKDWKGNPYTDFKLSEPQFDWIKGKRIYLNGDEYIEDILTNKKEEVIKKTKDKLFSLCNWRNDCIKRRDNLKGFDLENFKKAYSKLLSEYNGENISSEVYEKIRFID